LLRTVSSHAIANMSATLEHEHLGELRGKTVESAVQFLGLKYASIKDRLAAPQLVDSYASGTTDATKFGYARHVESMHHRC
jgi:carboxylesterase type B